MRIVDLRNALTRLCVAVITGLSPASVGLAAHGRIVDAPADLRLLPRDWAFPFRVRLASRRRHSVGASERPTPLATAPAAATDCPLARR